MILASIDVTKLLKEHFIKGKKGVYVDLIFKETPDSNYGDDYLVVQRISKEARINGERGPIVGNAKIRQDKPKDEPAKPEAKKPNHYEPATPEIPF